MTPRHWFGIHLLLSAAVFSLTQSAVCRTAFCQDPAPVIVRANLKPDSSVLVGQRIVLSIDVLATEGWANLPQPPTINTPGAIVYSPSSQGLRLNETINGASYTGQRTELWVFPQRPGKLMIPAIEVDVNVRQFGAGAESKTLKKKTEAITIDVALPPDAPVAEVICAQALSVSQTWRPELSTLEVQVGDGLERVIERKLNGAPALVLPPIRWKEVDGVRIYGKQPQLSEASNRGELTSQRTDAATYVFEKPGDYTLPDVAVVWWNLQDKEWRTESLSGMKVSAKASAAAESAASSEADAAESEPGNGQFVGWIAAIVGGGGLMLWLLWSGTLGTQWLTDLTESMKQSESYRFREFARAARRDEPQAALRHLMRWLDAFQNDAGPARLDDFLTAFGSPGDRKLGWEIVVAANENSDDWKGQPLLVAIQSARNNRRRTTIDAGRGSPLPQLNPQIRVDDSSARPIDY